MVILRNNSSKLLEDQVAKMITVRNGKILLLKEYGKDVYGLPGGKVEKNETVEDGLVRETREELTCTPTNYQLFNEVSIPGWNQGESYHFVYFIGELEGNIKPSSEIESLIWLSRKDIEEKSVRFHPHVLKTQILENLIAREIIK